VYIEGNDFVAMHEDAEWLQLFKVTCDSNGVDNQVTRVTSPENGRCGAASVGYAQGIYPANVPDWLHVEDGGEAILTCNANKVRGVYYDGDGAYRTYAQGISFIGMNNRGGSNRADFLKAVLDELAGYQGTINGHVLNNITGEPIEDATVEVEGLNISVQTDMNGQFTITRFPVEQFRVRIAAHGYTELASEFTFNGQPTIDLELRLLHPEMALDPGRIEVELNTDQTHMVELTISNGGDGPLDLSLRARAVRQPIQPWESIQTFEAGALLNDTRLECAMYFRDHYWIGGGGSGGAGTNFMYKLDRDWQLVETYDQGTFSLYGWRDLCTDGTFIYGVDSSYIAQFDPETGTRTEIMIPTPINPAWAVAYDEANGLFWVACTGSNIYGIDYDGNVVQTMRNQGRFRITGLAYWNEDPEGKPLYILGEYQDVDGRIVKVNPADGEPTIVLDVPLGCDERMGGGEFTKEAFPYTTCLVAQMQRGAQSVRTLEATTNFNWLTIEPSELTIEPGTNGTVNLTLSSAGFNVGDIATAYIQMDHNSLYEESFIDLQMEVVPVIPDVVEEDAMTPFAFGIESAYPNPFNGRTTLGFSLDKTDLVKLAVYDLAGREVTSLVDGRLSAGRQMVTLDASSWPTGIYMARLETVGRTDQIKLTLIK